MTVGELEQYVRSIEKGMNRLEEDMEHIKNNTVPLLFERLTDLKIKTLVSTALWGINIILLGFLLYKIFEIAGRIK